MNFSNGRAFMRNFVLTAAVMAGAISVCRANSIPITSVGMTINSQGPNTTIKVSGPKTTDPSSTATSPMTIQAGQTIDVEGGPATLTIGTSEIVVAPGTKLGIQAGSIPSNFVNNKFVLGAKTNPSIAVKTGSVETAAFPTRVYAGSVLSTDQTEMFDALTHSVLKVAPLTTDTVTSQEIYESSGLLTQIFNFTPAQSTALISPSAPH